MRELDPSFPIRSRATVQRLNHAYLGQTVDTARALGLGAVACLAADVTSGAFNRPGGWPAQRQAEVALSEEQIDRLEAEVERLITDRAPDIESGFVRERAPKNSAGSSITSGRSLGSPKRSFHNAMLPGCRPSSKRSRLRPGRLWRARRSPSRG